MFFRPGASFRRTGWPRLVYGVLHSSKAPRLCRKRPTSIEAASTPGQRCGRLVSTSPRCWLNPGHLWPNIDQGWRRFEEYPGKSPHPRKGQGSGRERLAKRGDNPKGEVASPLLANPWPSTQGMQLMHTHRKTSCACRAPIARCLPGAATTPSGRRQGAGRTTPGRRPGDAWPLSGRRSSATPLEPRSEAGRPLSTSYWAPAVGRPLLVAC